METNEKKLRKLLAKLDGPKIDEDDLKCLALAVIGDISGDDANSARVKVEALRLLKDIVIKDEAKKDAGDDGILAILNRNNGINKKKDKSIN